MGDHVVKWLLQPTLQHGDMADQVIVRLLARYLGHRGHEIDDGGYARGRCASDGSAQGAPIVRWCRPRRTADGRYAILSIANKPQASQMLTDTPMAMAVAWRALAPGFDPDAVAWTTVATAIGADPVRFNPKVEITMSAECWTRGAFATLGLPYVEVDDPAFPPIDEGAAP